MAHLSRRNSRAYSILSEDLPNTPRPTPPPPPPPPPSRRGGTRATSAASEAAIPIAETLPTTRVPLHYFLAPTVPSPFTGTLEASLDATLLWGRTYPGTTAVATALLQPVNPRTDWPAILQTSFGSANALDPKLGRFLLEEFLFLMTRTLLPEQIAENRAAMARLYERKKHLAIRLVLRYDMVREWCSMDGLGRKDMSVASVPPTITFTEKGHSVNAPISNRSSDTGGEVYERRPLMPNVWATLIAAPDGGYTTHGVRERMKHYVTPLDGYLLLSDEEVKGWSERTLVVRASQIVLQWQWLRQKNATLDEMECGGWEELDGRAEECEWIAEKREMPQGKSGKAGVDEAVQGL